MQRVSQVAAAVLILSSAVGAATAKAPPGSAPGLLPYDESLVQHALNLAQASYCIAPGANWTCPTCNSNIDLTSVIESKGGRALVGFDAGANNLFVAYRGSENIQNWIDNVKFFKTSPYPDMPDVEVEKGFWGWYTNLKDGVDSALAAAKTKYGCSEVAITGHSAGASVATLHAFDMARGESSTAGLSLKQVISFGSPRTGNSAFYSAHAAAIDANLTAQWRVTHYRDMVPHVPQELMGYRHVSTEVFYDEPSTTHAVCDGSGEDGACSDSCAPTHCTSISDHLDYLNTPLGSDAC